MCKHFRYFWWSLFTEGNVKYGSVSLNFSLPFFFLLFEENGFQIKMKLELLYFKISTPCFFFCMGLKILTKFSTEKLEIKCKLLTGRRIKATCTYFYHCKYQVYSIFLQDLNLFTWSWERSSSNPGSQPQTLNQKLNLKRSKKKRTNRRS